MRKGAPTGSRVTVTRFAFTAALGGVLTVALGWRADWWALVPLTIAAGVPIARLMPVIVHADKRDHPAPNRIVLAATLVAGLRFAVMIGAFYVAEQYLQRVAGFSPLGASGALVLVALLVGATVGAGLAGIVLSGTLTASAVHRTLLLGAVLCVFVGLPAATRLAARVGRAPGSPPAPDRRHARQSRMRCIPPGLGGLAACSRVPPSSAGGTADRGPARSADESIPSNERAGAWPRARPRADTARRQPFRLVGVEGVDRVGDADAYVLGPGLDCSS